MALLNTIVQQNFEKARDMIAQILASEFAVNTLVPSVYTERIRPFDKTNLPAVNVVFTSSSEILLDNANNKSTYTYSIDCYANGKADATTGAGAKATIDLHKIVGMVKQILLNPVYRNLLFDPEKVVQSRSITSIAIAEPTKEADATSTVMARVSFNVVIGDDMEKLTSVIATQSTTTVDFSETDDGYIWTVTE